MLGWRGQVSPGEAKLVQILRIVVGLLPRVGALTYVIGVAWLCMFPLMARRTYVSENALVPHSTPFTLPSWAAQTALERADNYTVAMDGVGPDEYAGVACAWIAERLEAIGLEPYEHHYEGGKNLLGILRARRADGKEAVVLAVPYAGRSERHPARSIAAGLGMVLELVGHLRRVSWLQKDIVFVAYDGRQQHAPGLGAWVRDYHASDPILAQTMPRAGILRAALVVEYSGKQASQISVLCSGMHGQLPNLDLINTLQRVVPQQLRLQVQARPLRLENPVRGWVEQHDRRLIPNVETLLSFMQQQATGVPNGGHGYFNSYHVDSVTLSDQASLPTRAVQMDFGTTRRVMATLERAVRSLNNLIEHLHQSFPFYLLASPSRYIPIGDYMVPMLLTSLLGVGSALSDLSKSAGKRRTAHTLAIMVFTTLASVAVFVAPRAVALEWPLPEAASLVVLLVASLCGLVVLHQMPMVAFPSPLAPDQDPAEYAELHTRLDTRSLRAFCLLWATMVGLCSTLINYSFGLLVLLVFGPIYSVIVPTHRRALRVVQIAILVLVSPPVLLWVGADLFGYGSAIAFAMDLEERFRLFGSPWWPYLSLVNAPVSILLMVAAGVGVPSPEQHKVKTD